MKKHLNHLFLLVFIVLFACNESDKFNESAPSNEQIQKVTSERFWKNTPAFNVDSCYNYIKYQVNLGPRNPGSEAHEKCVQWLKASFERYGLKVELQKFSAVTYDNKQWIGTNIIAKYQPELKHRILLCAHYDTRPFADRDKDDKNKNKPIPGANDGASGVAVLMSIAQTIQLKNIGLDIVLFDLEDYGNPGGDSETWCLGSQYWSKNISPMTIKPQEGILLDMVGDTNAIFPKEGLSIHYHPMLVHDIWAIAQKAGFGNYFIDESSNNITDDHLFINTHADIPTINIIHYYPQKSDFFEHHHTLHDDLKNISKSTLNAVGQTVLYYLYKQDEKLSNM